MQPETQVSQPEEQLVERRRGERVNQPQSVTVSLDPPGKDLDFHAVLVNVSCSGLAIRHWRKELAVGQRVRIAFLAKGEVLARVMWNWAVGPVVISGLERVQESPVIGFGPRPEVEGGIAGPRTVSRGWLLAALTGLLFVVGWYFSSRGW